VKLVKANIYGFGKWVDQKFNFEQDYQVIFGFNEAGKTTLLNFIKSILFGFASARGDNKYLQYRPKNSSNYGGELEFQAQDGSTWTVRRIDGKGDGEVTLYHDDQQVPESDMSQIIGSFTKDDFENTHVFDDKSILSIYGLDENKLETEVMSIGAVGSKDWLATADKLNHSAENIYKQRGQKQPLVVNLLAVSKVPLDLVMPDRWRPGVTGSDEQCWLCALPTASKGLARSPAQRPCDGGGRTVGRCQGALI